MVFTSTFAYLSCFYSKTERRVSLSSIGYANNKLHGMLVMDKRKLSETDIISKFILPTIKTTGLDDTTQIHQEVNF